MASYKAEVLHQTYKRRLRPRSHYSVGWLPRWAKVGSAMPRFANRSMDVGPLRKMALKAAGVDTRRRMPAFARRTFRRTFGGAAGTGTPVVLFVDSFTNHFAPQVADAAVEVLRAAGYDPRITRQQECCGLPWISTGQLDGAAKRLRGMVDALAADAKAGVPIVGIEPSCTAVLRHELRELVPGPDAAAVAAATLTLAEALALRPEWTPPDLTGVRVVAQPHCHHHAVMGWSADQALLEKAGATVEAVAGCCGMAGNFGVEQGHYEVSLAVAEQNLLPALRASAGEPRRVVLADGFSCRTQLAELAEDETPLHLAQLLARGVSAR
jgi:Fe-S oxidoreductase